MGMYGVLGHLGGRLRRWLLGSWQRGYGRLAPKSPWGWRHGAPAYLRSLCLILFGKCSHKHTHVHTHKSVHKDTPLGFPLICWTWRLTQELAIEKAGPSFMCLTLLVRSIVKVINMEGEDRPLLFPLCAITPKVSSKHLLLQAINCVNEGYISLLIDFHFMWMSITALLLSPFECESV